MKKQLLFSPRTEQSLFNEIKEYADEGHGARATMNEYYHRAGEIGDQMEEDRHIDLVCSSLRFQSHAELIANLDNDIWIVANSEDFDNA